jgi:hypothetical protein
MFTGLHGIKTLKPRSSAEQISLKIKYHSLEENNINLK